MARKQNTTVHGPCALCLNERDLRRSHIIPAFAYRWLRSRSVTGYIRSSREPNRRVQDGDKPPLLCTDCEQIFSRDEAEFSSKLFQPILSGVQNATYEEWMLRFAVSLSWRVLKHCKGKNPLAEYTPDQNLCAEQASAAWRNFLLGSAPHPGKYEQHLLVFTELEHGPSHLPSNINRYLLGGIEMDIVGGDKSLMTFAKIGRFAFFGLIARPLGNWAETKIHVRQGTIKPGRFQAPDGIGKFLLGRARGINKVQEEMSPAQRQKAQEALNHAVLSDPDSFIQSDHGRAIIADAKLFGEQAVLSKS